MKKLTLSQQKQLYLKARQAYYDDPNGNTIMSDSEFDALEKSIARQHPDWHVLKTTGHTKKTDVELPNFMPSLSKIYKWTGRQSGNGYVWTPKLDGTSLQLVYNNGKPSALYTRGNGITGGDVSFLLPFLDIPKTIPYTGELFLRCEGVLTRDKFNRKWRRKEGDEKNPRKFASARAAVNGQFNRTVADCIPELLHDIDLVVVGVYNRRCGEMLKFAKSQGFKTAPELKFESVSHESLEAMLQWARKAIPCDIDGLVCAVRTAVFQYADSEFPAWAHAFKVNSDGVETTVTGVRWQISRYGRWTPVISVEPVDFDGVTVTNPTAHNAKWMVDRGLGVGARVKLIRAGEVIPYIDEVVKKSKNFIYPPGKYKWDGVHLVTVGKSEASDKAKVLQMTSFLRGIGLEGIQAKGVQALVDQGYVSVPHIMADLMSGVQSKVFPQRIKAALGNANGLKFGKSLFDICKKGIPLARIAAHSGAMGAGLGRTNLDKIAKAMPLSLILYGKPDNLADRIKAVHGLGPAVANIVIEGQDKLRKIVALVEKAGVKVLIPTSVAKGPVAKEGPFKGMIGAWTGYRDKEQEAAFIAGGGLVDKLNSKTTILFYNPDGKFLDKVEKFKAKGGKAVVWSKWYKA